MDDGVAGGDASHAQQHGADDVLTHAQQLMQATSRVGHISDFVGGQRLARQVTPSPEHAAGLHWSHPSDGFEQGALATQTSPQHGEQMPARSGEADVVQDAKRLSATALHSVGEIEEFEHESGGSYTRKLAAINAERTRDYSGAYGLG